MKPANEASFQPALVATEPFGTSPRAFLRWIDDEDWTDRRDVVGVDRVLLPAPE